MNQTFIVIEMICMDKSIDIDNQNGINKVKLNFRMQDAFKLDSTQQR